METVIKCEKTKEWNGKPIYTIHLSDGRGGESFASEIPVGTPVSELTITPNGNYPDKIKWNKPGSGGGGFSGRQRAGNESFALSYAKDYAVASISAGKEWNLDYTLKMADKFYEWLEVKKNGSKPQQEKPYSAKDDFPNPF